MSIICVYNKEDVLEDCLLASLKKQSYTDYEIILVDSVKHGFDKASDALNFGGNLAKGNYLIFLHQDVVFEDIDVLGKIANECENTDFDYAGLVGFTVDKNDRIKFYSNIVHGNNKVPVSDNVVKINTPTEVYSLDECVLIIPRKVFSKNKFRDLGKTWHMYGLDYALQIKDNGGKIKVLPVRVWHQSDGKSFNLNYYDAVKSLCLKSTNHRNIYTIWGKWPTNRGFITLKVLYRKARYKIVGY